MSSTHHSNVVPSEVGWQFVPQYYTFVNKEPQRLHCFYSKNSTFSHGTEGEDVKQFLGQQEIHKKITSIGFEDCKVFIHSVDAQASANNGIIIQVIGEMSNHGDTWRKFVQTFFLAEQPNGYFVLNDIFRFLKEESVDDDEVNETGEPTEDPTPATTASQVPTGPATELPDQPATPVAAPEPVYEQSPEATPAPPTVPVVLEPTPVAAPVEEPPREVEPAPEPTQTPTPVPEPVAAPAVLPNGHASEPESIPAPTPPVTEPSPRPSPSSLPAAPSPAPLAPAVSQYTPPAPQQPVAPPPPRSWASLAASNPKKWGAVAQDAKGVSETVTTSSTPGSGSQTPAAPTPTPAGSQAHHGRSNQQKNEHPAFIAAQSVTTAHCFVKGVIEPISQAQLQQTLTSRFGPIKDLEIVRGKACAFLEFHSVDSARRAITASLPQPQGGEGGVRIEARGESHRISIETKKEKGDRPPSRPHRGGVPGQQVNGGERGGPPQGRGNFRGRSGGGQGGKGVKLPP